MRIIPRGIELELIEKSGPWKMIYGRRKTGKSFLVENFLKYDRFFFVNRDSTVMDKFSMEKYNWNEFLKVFRELLGVKKIVIDEFHRLPSEFLDFLHSMGSRGELILITSTLWLAKKLLGEGSPLIGLVYPIKIGLIDERDLIKSLSSEFSGKELIEVCVYLREPFLIPNFKPPLREFLTNFLYENKYFLKNLIGEIFSEEERELTNVYDVILRAISNGRNVSTEISTTLFSRGLIVKDNPGVVQKYLDILTDMGIIEKFKVYGKRKFKYMHISPLLDLHFYLEEKYSYVEVDTPLKFIKNVVEIKIPIHVEQFFRSLLSKIFGLQPQLIEEKDFELDLALFKFNDLELIGEVKWRDYVSVGEVKSIEDKMGRFKGVKKILIVPNEKVLEKVPEGIEVWDVDTLLRFVLEG
ncbi:MAG: AAA family ATPase [Candidatus Methanomethylicia archaeon]